MSDYDEEWENQDFTALTLDWINDAKRSQDEFKSELKSLKAEKPDKNAQASAKIAWEDKVEELEFEIEEIEVWINSYLKSLDDDEDADYVDVIPVDFTDRILKKLSNISNHDTQNGTLDAEYKIYIIEISKNTGKGNYVFYVGHTTHEIDHRIDQHFDGGDLSARMFKNGNYNLECARDDLYELLPQFHSKRAADKAEGLVADFLSRRGFAAYSDQGKFAELRKKKKSN